VTDSDAKLKKACDVNSWTRIACFAHDLHLLVSRDGLALNKKEATERVLDEEDHLSGVQALPQVKDLIDHCRAIVEYFKRSKCQRR
jgi:hypothetical protein